MLTSEQILKSQRLTDQCGGESNCRTDSLVPHRRAVSRISSDDFFVLLRKRVKEAGNQKKWANEHNISPQYVNDVLHGRREPGEKICKALGLRRVVFYEYLK